LTKEQLQTNLKETLRLTEIIDEQRSFINRNLYKTKLTYVPKRAILTFLLYWILVLLSKFDTSSDFYVFVYKSGFYNDSTLVLLIVLSCIYHIYVSIKTRPKVKNSEILLNDTLKNRENLAILHEDFINTTAIKRFIKYLDTGLADDLKECITIYHQEMQNEKIISEIHSAANEVASATSKGLSEIKSELEYQHRNPIDK
jgi:hypothetical protein